MTQTTKQCSTPGQLLSFLRGQLSASEEAELQQHLDDCVLCREQLENTAADTHVWKEAREFFGSGALHASSKDSGHQPEEANQGSHNIRQVLDSLGPTDDPESLGRIGGYEVTGVVGAGGMGVVLKAHDRSLDRIVAIKVMSPHLASSGSARKRFAREAKAAAAVLHPNVIAIHSVASEDANPYLVMPFVRGASLQKRIDAQGPVPLKDTLRIGSQIAAGLAAAHEQGLVHRDIKPANILLEEGVERVTITDFGLARAVDDASMTCSGVIAGTPQYMSPEQARGEPIDSRSDLFSLGGVMYAMCTGRAPFRAETTYGVLHRIATDKPTPVCEVNSDVPVWLGHLIDRMMAKRPEDRFESAAQVADLLERCLAHVQQPAAISLPAAVATLANKVIRRPTIGTSIAVAAAVLAFIFAGVFVALELNKGTLTIKSDVDDIQVRITCGDEVVNELKVTNSSQSVRIAAGQYKVEIIGNKDGITVENGQVTLHRGDTEVVKIIHRTSIASPAADKAPSESLPSLQSNSADPLSEPIDQFNLVQNKTPLNDQPILTTDELIACASWNLERNNELTGTVKAALRKIAKQHQWPDGWRIDGAYLDLPPDGTPVRAYRISLVHTATGEQITIRQRFIEPSPEYAISIPRAEPLDGTNLAEAIQRFNARNNQANGRKQPPLTENEVVAAIIHHQTKRDQADVSDALFEKFQQIARTRYLPKGASLDVIPTFGAEGGSAYTIWSVRIQMLQDEVGKEGWTYAFEVREQFVSVRHGDAGDIHWGQPAENGLQAGVRLSPPLLKYMIGQEVHVEIFYRNILTKPISAIVPNFCGYEVVVHDANGTNVEVFDIHELIIGGARLEQILGNEPTISRGRSFAFAPASLDNRQLEEYRSKTGGSMLILAEPGGSYRLQFTVSNIADAAEGTLKTGSVNIAVENVKERNAEAVVDATYPPTAGNRGLSTVEEHGESLTQQAFQDWRQKRFLSEQGIEAAAIRDMAMQNDGKPELPAQSLRGKTIQQLQGKWRLTRQIAADGDERSMPAQSVWEFQGNRVIVRDGGPGGAMLIEVDDSQSPVHVKMTIELDEESGLGLMSVEGDKAIVCLGEAQKSPEPESRPKSLQWVAGVWYMELTRLKPDEAAVPLNPALVVPMGETSVVPRPTTATKNNSLAIDHRNARSVVEAYVAAALAGDIAKAVPLARNSPADPKRIQELPDFLNVQRLKIETVYVNDTVNPTLALATSVAVKLEEERKNPGGRRDGFLVFRLKFADDQWLVIDVDFETESGAEEELNEFLKDHPKSFGVPPRLQVDPMAESER